MMDDRRRALMMAQGKNEISWDFATQPYIPSAPIRLVYSPEIESNGVIVNSNVPSGSWGGGTLWSVYSI